MLEREVSTAFFIFYFFGIKNAELFLIFIRNCRTMKSAIGTIIIFFFLLIKGRANFTDTPRLRLSNFLEIILRKYFDACIGFHFLFYD